MTSTVQLAAGSYDNITAGNENKLQGECHVCMSVSGSVRKCWRASVPSLYWYTILIIIS